MQRLLFLPFVLVPLIEIALFIMIGQTIGLVPTLLGVLVTALIGSVLIRRQGLSLLFEIQTLANRGQLPARQIVEGIMLAVAGALLLTPGYFTDTIGFVLLVPPVRHALYSWLKSRVTVTGFAAGATAGSASGPGAPPRDPDVIDLDDDDWRRR